MDKFYRKYVLAAFIPAIVFTFFHWLMWNIVVKDIVNNPCDLSRLAYLKISNNNDTFSSSIKKFTGQKTDILTIGDCFFRLNFQNYLEKYSGLEVINITNLKWLKYPINPNNNPVNIIAMMINSGYIDEIKPKYILLESIQRNAILRFAISFDLSTNDSIGNLRKFFKEFPEPENVLPTYTFINNGNYKYIINNYKLRRYGNQTICYSKDVCSTKLAKRVFDSYYPDTLFFEKGDIDSIELETDGNVKLLVRNLNKLSALLKSKGISLIVLIAPDKYSYYADYIEDKSLKKSLFFKKYKNYKKNFITLDYIPHIEGKNTYYPQDTRWGTSYQDFIAKEIAKKLR